MNPLGIDECVHLAARVWPSGNSSIERICCEPGETLCTKSLRRISNGRTDRQYLIYEEADLVQGIVAELHAIQMCDRPSLQLFRKPVESAAVSPILLISMWTRARLFVT